MVQDYTRQTVNYLEISTMDRRTFIISAGLALPIAGTMPASALNLVKPSNAEPDKKADQSTIQRQKADYTIRIGVGLVEVGPQHIISTITYNGQFPGPLLRFEEGRQAIVDIYNDTDSPEQFHWHGQFIPVSVDGSAEEGTPYIPAHGMRREIFIPKPAGLRFYHTHTVAGQNIIAGNYSGLVGHLFI
jgi:FtsP/CotA-like multicopper oxidase with cupredoxin domain